MTTGKRALRLGTAPDSWGVWFANDPRQVPWQRFLDEVASAGFRWVELGPYGYLPRDADSVRTELRKRGLSLSGGCIGGDLTQPGAVAALQEELQEVTDLTAELGGEYLVFLPPMADREMKPDEWSRLTEGLAAVGEIASGQFGLRLAFHHHADSYVETQEQTVRLLEMTDPEFVGLCLDTGHLSYHDGDSLAIVRGFGDRIACLHIKQVSTLVLEQVRAERLTFAEAVARRVMCEPPTGVPDLKPVLDAVGELGRGTFVVEQDLYPCDPDEPLPIARRTRDYLATVGFSRDPDTVVA